MLKLEKAAKTRELNVILRDKPSLLSRPFLEALSYALFFHLMALLLFTISPFKISYEASIFPPVHVATDFISQQQHQQVSAYFDAHSQVPAFLIEPKHAPSQLPPMVASSGLQKEAIETYKRNALSENIFRILEARIESPSLETIMQGSVSRPSLIVTSSGGMSEGLVLVENELDSDLKQFAKRHPSLLSPTPYRFVFSVQMEQRTGKIFWWDLIDEDKDNNVKNLAIALLEKLRFKIDTKRIIESGNIELSILLMKD